VVGSPPARRAGEFSLNLIEELEAVQVVGEQPAFEQVEGQAFQLRDPGGALADRKGLSGTPLTPTLSLKGRGGHTGPLKRRDR
jgi:hypothetical protein